MAKPLSPEEEGEWRRSFSGTEARDRLWATLDETRGQRAYLRAQLSEAHCELPEEMPETHDANAPLSDKIHELVRLWRERDRELKALRGALFDEQKRHREWCADDTDDIPEEMHRLAGAIDAILRGEH